MLNVVQVLTVAMFKEDFVERLHYMYVFLIYGNDVSKA